jgi:hypothetical protein
MVAAAASFEPRHTMLSGCGRRARGAARQRCFVSVVVRVVHAGYLNRSTRSTVALSTGGGAASVAVQVFADKTCPACGAASTTNERGDFTARMNMPHTAHARAYPRRMDSALSPRAAQCVRRRCASAPTPLAAA